MRRSHLAFAYVAMVCCVYMGNYISLWKRRTTTNMRESIRNIDCTGQSVLVTCVCAFPAVVQESKNCIDICADILFMRNLNCSCLRMSPSFEGRSLHLSWQNCCPIFWFPAFLSHLHLTSPLPLSFADDLHLFAIPRLTLFGFWTTTF